jgi:hypothetical protein
MTEDTAALLATGSEHGAEAGLEWGAKAEAVRWDRVADEAR